MCSIMVVHSPPKETKFDTEFGSFFVQEIQIIKNCEIEITFLL